MLKEARLIAPLHNNSGYAKAGRALMAALLSVGVRVEAQEFENHTTYEAGVNGVLTERVYPAFENLPRPAVQNAELAEAMAYRAAIDAPNLILCSPDGMSTLGAEYPGTRIGITMLEADALCPYWKRAMENVHGIITPCADNAAVFTREGPGVPVYTVPLCVDERLWSRQGLKAQVAGRPDFLFLAIFSTCERKGWRELIHAFTEEFPGESVGLLVKPGRAAEVEELVTWAKERGVWLSVLDGTHTDEQMAMLYRAADAYALPSAEGFGLTFVEAGLCGLRLCGLDRGGAGDVIDALAGTPIQSAPAPCVGHLPQIYRSEMHWHRASVPAVRRALREAYTTGTIPAPAALAQYSRPAIGARLASAVEAIQDERKRRVFTGGTKSRKPAPALALVTTYNDLSCLPRLVDSLRRYSPSVRIVIADDGSTDGTPEYADREGLTVVRNPHTGNLSLNRNAAIAQLLQEESVQKAKPALICLDSDVEAVSDWHGELCAILRKTPEIGIVAPAKCFPDGSLQNIGNRMRPNGATFGMKLEQALSFPDYVETACLVARWEFWTSRQFDPQFEFWYYDADYCFQARAAGYTIAATNTVRVRHYAHTASVHRHSETEPQRLAFLRKWKEVL